MTLLWVDGFDHYGSTFPASSGPSALVNATLVTDPVRTGTHSLRLNGAAAVYTVPIGSVSHIIFGVAINIAAYHASSSDNMKIQLLDEAASPLEQINISISQIGRLEARRGNGLTLLGTSTKSIVLNVWNYIEARIKYGTADGEMEIRLNEEVVLNLSSVNTTRTTAATGQYGKIGFRSNSIDTYYDDFWVLNKGAGPPLDDFLGFKRCRLYVPIADGPTLQWTALSGGVHVTEIDETVPDEDASYIEEGTVGGIDEFEIENSVSPMNEVDGIFVGARAKLDAAGSDTFRINAKRSTSVTNGSSKSPTTSYGTFHQAFELDPETAGSWNPSTFDDLLIQVEKTS